MSTPRRHVFMFQSHFAPLVLAGAKTTTIRAPRKRKVRVGDILDLRQWSGLPYRSSQIKLREAVCVAVEPLEITHHRAVFIGRKMLLWDEVSDLAGCDGFNTPQEMLLWFEQTHGLPFKGTRYRWEARA